MRAFCTDQPLPACCFVLSACCRENTARQLGEEALVDQEQAAPEGEGCAGALPQAAQGPQAVCKRECWLGSPDQLDRPRGVVTLLKF